MTPLSLAVQSGHEGVVKLLLARDDVMAESISTSLFYVGGNEAVARLLLQQDDVDAGVKKWYDMTPLHNAAEGGHETVVRLLLQRSDVDANSQNVYGQTPLDAATKYNHEMVARLLQQHIPVYATSKNAVKTGNKIETLRTLPLKQKDAEANFKDDQGRPPIVHASEGVDADSRDTRNRTPLSYAARWGHRAEGLVILMLNRNDADANSKDTENRTPLSYAAQRGDKGPRKVRFLLAQNDVDAHSNDDQGCTPLYYASETFYLSENVISLLRSATVQRSLDESPPPVQRRRLYR